MALTVATGFVVDDAIVVSGEHHPARRENGMPRYQAGLGGRWRGQASPSMSMSISLIAVFHPDP